MAKIVEVNNWMSRYMRRLCLNYIGDKPEINFPALLKDTAVYLAKWSSITPLEAFDPEKCVYNCPICNYYYEEHANLLKQGRESDAKTLSKNFTSAIEYATRLPTSLNSAPFAWYTLKTLLKVPLDVAVNTFDPLSCLSHLILNTCANKSLSLEQRNLHSLFLKMSRVENNGYTDKPRDEEGREEEEKEREEEEAVEKKCMLDECKKYSYVLPGKRASYYCRKLGITFHERAYYRDVHIWLPHIQYGTDFTPACINCKTCKHVRPHA